MIETIVGLIVGIIGLIGMVLFETLGSDLWESISDFGLFYYFILLGILLWSTIKLYKSDYIRLSKYVFIIFSYLFGFGLFFLAVGTALTPTGFGWRIFYLFIIIITFVIIHYIFYSITTEERFIENEDEEFGKEENKDEKKYEEEESFEEDYAEGEDLDSKYANILGLKGKVTFTEIKNSYKNKMKEYHPDKVDNMGEKLKNLAEKESKMINEAYEYFKKKNR